MSGILATEARGMIDVVARAICIAAAAASVQQYTIGSLETPSRPKTHDEWAAEVVARADALRRAARRA